MKLSYKSILLEYKFFKKIEIIFEQMVIEKSQYLETKKIELLKDFIYKKILQYLFDI